jgi:hypothetical protein
MPEPNPNRVYVNALRIIYFVLSISGILFTTILLLILGKKLKKNKHSDIILTVLTVFVDAVSSGGLLFRAVFTQFPYNLLKEHYGWCAYDNLINNFSLTYSGYILGVLSAQRMLLIVFNIRVSIYIWLAIAGALYFSMTIQIVYHIIEGNVSLSLIEVFCLIKGTQASKAIYMTMIVCGLATYIITIISYLVIIVFSCKQCLKQLTMNLDKATVYRECRTIIFKSLLFLIPYMTIYFGRIYCWLYEMILGKARTFSMEYTAIILQSTSVIVNCLTILYMHKEVNKDFVNFIVKIKRIFYN